MLQANTTVAVQLAEAMERHQGNKAEMREARQRLAKFEAMIAVLEEQLGLATETEQDEASASASPGQMERP